MAAVQRSEFALALNQIASERGVDPQVVIDTIKGAILAAYRKDNPISDEEAELYSVNLNESTGETSILKEGKDITPPGFGRIAAQTAKQVLLQKIREKEKDAVLEEYSKRIGTVVNGMVLRFMGPVMVLDIGKAEAIMEPQEKIPSEQYFINKKMPVYIKSIDDEKREILVSRADNGLLEGLLKREVPEVSSGSVVIKKIVREPGNRAKIAVYSEQSGIDPVGSCVGQKGVRIQAIIDALDGLEKIDVIQWSPEIAKLIMNALSPAKKLRVEVDEKAKVAHVFASPDELPLVIGREGQNVRLASKLTDYTIEVEGEEMPEFDEDKKEEVKEKIEEPKIEEKAVEEVAEEAPEEPKTEEVQETVEEVVEPKTEEVVETVEEAPVETQESPAIDEAPSEEEKKEEVVEEAENPVEEDAK